LNKFVSVLIGSKIKLHFIFFATGFFAAGFLAGAFFSYCFLAGTFSSHFF
jgi:hypothetical protein